jgi:2-polyprenyl-6-hydroxyphenyl methylase/3-demethylubiquinone-9 3-methyltransferase
LRILDVGSGRRPALAPADRPAGTHYVGLDLSAVELAAAPNGSYDETVAADLAQRVAGLEGQFDLALSWQVFEHVRPLDRALENLRAYLRPGGRMVAVLSGRFSINALVNVLVPSGLAVWLMRRLLGRDPDSVFSAHYDSCYASALTELLKSWSVAEVTPLFQGGAYFNFALPLRSVYFRYENWASRAGRANLATHYKIDSVR